MRLQPEFLKPELVQSTPIQPSPPKNRLKNRTTFADADQTKRSQAKALYLSIKGRAAHSELGGCPSNIETIFGKMPGEDRALGHLNGFRPLGNGRIDQTFIGRKAKIVTRDLVSSACCGSKAENLLELPKVSGPVKGHKGI